MFTRARTLKATAPIWRSACSALHTSSAGSNQPFSRRIALALTAGTITTAALATQWALSKSPLQLDDNIGESPDSVKVDKAVDPLPRKIKFTTSYELLGFGTRSVTFLGFKVYALGIYVASEDIKKIPTVLDSKYLSSEFIDTDSTKSHSDNVLVALQDPNKSTILISNLLDSNIRLVARISPIRNTDFNHLKDGLVKSILAAKIKDEELDIGLQELKDAFIRRGSVPKNHNLILERLPTGELQLYYENTSSGILSELGRVKTPLVSKVLFLQYLSGGLSPNTKESCIQRISQLV